MKFNTTTTTTATTTLLLLLSTPILAGVAPAAAAEECGDLGVMTYTAAGDTEGVDPAQIRKCKEHPLGPDARPEGAVGPRPDNSTAGGNNLGATGSANAAEHLWKHKHGWGKCWDIDPGEHGCSKGYCYKACSGGKGDWCWTARNKGYGSWKKCDAKADCKVAEGMGCGKGCKSGRCSC